MTRQGFADIEKGIKELAIKGRDGKLTVDELMGGNFTITNGGVFGSLMLHNHQPTTSGYLGYAQNPRTSNGSWRQREILPMMYLKASYDHRLIDGRESVGLVTIKELLEDPARLLLDV